VKTARKESRISQSTGLTQAINPLNTMTAVAVQQTARLRAVLVANSQDHAPRIGIYLWHLASVIVACGLLRILAGLTSLRRSGQDLSDLFITIRTSLICCHLGLRHNMTMQYIERPLMLPGANAIVSRTAA
jgi:hypothetical protein